jgi:hypothetical protein
MSDMHRLRKMIATAVGAVLLGVLPAAVPAVAATVPASLGVPSCFAANTTDIHVSDRVRNATSQARVESCPADVLGRVNEADTTFVFNGSLEPANGTWRLELYPPSGPEPSSTDHFSLRGVNYFA